MSAYAIGIPDGTHDRLPAYMARLRAAEEGLSNLFSRFGYGEIQTPNIEYFQTFLRADAPFAEQDMFMLTDRNGRFVVLRPDNTTPAVRLYASRLYQSGTPTRLCYFQKTFVSTQNLRGLKSETRQAGIELFGSSSVRADLEVLALAVRALERCGVKQFHIEIGNAGLFKELTAALGGGDDLSEHLRILVEQKNYAALKDALAPFGENAAAQAIIRLTSMFGGPEVLDEAASIASSNMARDAIDRLRALYSEIKHAKLDDYVRFDMGLVHRINYYTGIVFHCYAEGAAEPLLSGGRYDDLPGKFNAPSPAIGWALDMDATIKCVESVPCKQPHEVVAFENGMSSAALAYVEAGVNRVLSFDEPNSLTGSYTLFHADGTIERCS